MLIVARMGEVRGVYRVLVGKPEGKRHVCYFDLQLYNVRVR